MSGDHDPVGQLYREVGGVRYYIIPGVLWNLTWPFATICVSPSIILIKKSFGKTIRIPKDEIKSLRIDPWLLSYGLHIQTWNKQLNGPVTFWTFSPEELKRNLHMMGYREFFPTLTKQSA